RPNSLALTEDLTKCSWINFTDHEIRRTCERLLCLRENALEHGASSTVVVTSEV
ncbi:hypothetical protein U1Q18_009566, partial [Sarracenia purpurea var. burkii]